jgi:hypothetical protein
MDKIERYLIETLRTAHPKPLARLAYEIRNFQGTAAGVEASCSKAWRRVVDAVIAADFDTSKALREGSPESQPSVTVTATRRASNE